MEYTSTNCRIGKHKLCQEQGIVPNCACPCHKWPEVEEALESAAEDEDDGPPA